MNHSIPKRCAECNQKFEEIVRKNKEIGFKILRDFVSLDRTRAILKNEWKAKGWKSSFCHMEKEITINASFGLREVRWSDQCWLPKKSCESKMYFDFLRAQPETRKIIAKKISQREVIPLLVLRRHVKYLRDIDKHVFRIVFQHLCAIC